MSCKKRIRNNKWLTRNGFVCIVIMLSLCSLFLVGCGKSTDSRTGGGQSADNAKTPAGSSESLETTESLYPAYTGEEGTTAMDSQFNATSQENTSDEPEAVRDDSATDRTASDDSADSSSSTDDKEKSNRSGAVSKEKVRLDPSWKYAKNSKIKSGEAVLYQHPRGQGKGITVCVNAGHGTKGGESVMTLCHPDGSPKVTGGTTGKGARKAVAVSSGMTFQDGTSESTATLTLAKILKEDLLEAGYNVLMIREKADVQLDNVARTVIANNMADCHIALHYDDSGKDKGVFYISVPDNSSYRSMEPVKSLWKEDNRLGAVVVSAIHKEGFKLFNNGELPLDLTQTSYSTVPYIDLEVGDAASDYSSKTQKKLSKGMVKGINKFFGQ